MYRYSVDILIYSGPSVILGSEGKQNTVYAGAGDVRFVAISINYHEQTQCNL